MPQEAAAPIPRRALAVDALGLALGLGLALALGWRTTDLIWSLWLSSLVLGFAAIAIGVVRHGAAAAQGPAAVFGIAFLLAFFALHFGLFHLVHSAFLGMFFPLQTAGPHDRGPIPGAAVYAQVFTDYWPWLLAAAIAERGALAQAWHVGDGARFTPMLAYANVVRMHLLIFFFAAVHALGLEHFAVYAVVYAVYFFPWRRWRRRRAGAG
ncbi:MAG: DUF6498-containing protein [Planctomycetota bacterium]